MPSLVGSEMCIRDRHIQFQEQPTEENVRTTVAPAATGFQAIEAHPVSQAGPVIGPHVQRAQTLSTETQPVTATPKPHETQASWQATDEEMTRHSYHQHGHLSKCTVWSTKYGTSV